MATSSITPSSTTSLLKVPAGRLESIAYYCVGIQTEAGPTPYTRLANAGGASGLSVGVFQHDFGQHRASATPYAQAIFDWNNQNGSRLNFTQAAFVAALKSSALTRDMVTVAQKFGESSEGATWIHQNFDVPHLQEAVQAAERAFKTPYGQNILREGSHVDEFAAFAIKVYNQYGPGVEGANGSAKRPGFGALMDYIKNGFVLIMDNRSGHAGDVVTITADQASAFNLDDLLKFSSGYATSRKTFNVAVREGPINALRSGSLYKFIMESASPLSDILLRQEYKGDFAPEKIFSDPDAAISRALFGADTEGMRRVVASINDLITINPQQINSPLGQFPATIWVDPITERVAVSYQRTGGGYVMSDDGYTTFDSSSVIKIEGIRTLKIGVAGNQQIFDIVATPNTNSTLPRSEIAVTPSTQPGGPPVEPLDIYGTPRISSHADGSMTVEFKMKKDLADGSIKEGELVSFNYRGDSVNDKNFRSMTAWKRDGTVEVRERSEDGTQETWTQWDRNCRIINQFTIEIGSNGAHRIIGDFIKDGKSYYADGTPKPSGGVTTGQKIDPGTVVVDPAGTLGQDEARAIVESDICGKNYGLGEIDPQALPPTALDFIPTGSTTDIIKKLLEKGFSVEQTENSLFAQKGDEYFIISDGVVEMGKGTRYARIDVVNDALVVSDTAMGQDARYVLSEVAGRSVLVKGSVAAVIGDDVEQDLNSFQVESIISVGGQSLGRLGSGTYGLNADDYLLYGLTFDNLVKNTLSKPATDLLTGLDPTAIASNHWATPQVTVTNMGGGMTKRSISLGNGVILSSVRNADQDLVSTFAKTSDGGQAISNYEGDGVRDTLTLVPGAGGLGLSYTLTSTVYDPVTRKGETRQTTIRAPQGPTEAERQQQLQDQLYGGMTTFLNALRSKDRTGMLLAGGKMALDYARYSRPGNETLNALDGVLNGVSTTVGVLGALQGLRSHDKLTQLSSTTSLLGSANYIAGQLGAKVAGELVNGKVREGFLSEGSLKLLSQVGAVLSLARMKDVPQMLENGQIGSTIGSVVGAVNAAAFITEAQTTMTGATVAGGGSVTLAGEGAFIPMDPATMVAFVVATFVLDELFGENPLPPPPTGQAHFMRLADGTLGYEISNAAHGGQEILTSQLDAILAQLNAQIAYANGRPLTSAQMALLQLSPEEEAALDLRPRPNGGDALALVASRIPTITLQSWPADKAENGKSNYFFVLESRDPQTGLSTMNGIAREDLVRHFNEALVYPQALVNQWEVDQLKTKFGTNEANWKTEGQWATAQSTLEQQRKVLRDRLAQADTALKNTQRNTLSQGAEQTTGAITGNVQLTGSTPSTTLKTAQSAFDAAKRALQDYEARNPQDGQAGARMVDSALTDATTVIAAREGATRQRLKVIALDWGGLGVTHTALPTTAVEHTLETLGWTGQGDGVARFDVDNDGYQEATEWLSPSAAMLGIDRDNNGALDSANELFNGINTPFDQRGWASLKYYDSNNDGLIDARDPVYQQLRLWFDVDGDGSSGELEVYDLQMNHPGMDMAQLQARVDAAGKVAWDTLANSAVQSINLVTLKAKLKDGKEIQVTQEQLQSEVRGMVSVMNAATQNLTVVHEDGMRENYITLVQDMTMLEELDHQDIPKERKAGLQALARQYGLDPDHPEFMAVVRGLKSGGMNLGNTDIPIYLGNDSVWIDKDLKQQLEQMRFSFHAATAVGGDDVFGTATLAPRILADTSIDTPVSLGSWTNTHAVTKDEILSDSIAAASNPTAPEQWIDPKNIYTIFDMVIKGAQSGGLVTQQALIVSRRSGGSPASVPMQVYTAAAPIATLASTQLAGREDERFGFAYRQLELEARAQLTGVATATLLGILKVDHGRIELDDSNKRLSFIPEENYYGTQAGFSYAVRDNRGRVLERRVNFKISPINDAPIVLGESISSREDIPLLLSPEQLLGNDKDIEGDLLKIIGIGRVGIGSATLEPTGQIRYRPPQDLYDITDTVEYIVQDTQGNSSIGIIKITLSAVDDAPTVASEVIRNAREDTHLRIDPALLLANDHDTDFNLNTGAEALHITSVGQPTHGFVFLDAGGHIIFVPEENFHGKATFEYTVTDTTGLSTTGKAVVDIDPVNDAPQVADETLTSLEDTPLAIDADLLLINDRDADIQRGEAQTLQVIAVNGATHGAVTLTNGHINFTPTLNYYGDAKFDYTISDGCGGLAQASVILKIAPVNDAPQAPNRVFTTMEDTPLEISSTQLLAGIFDIESGNSGLSIKGISNIAGGSISQAGAAYTFTPKANLTGLASFDYSVQDAGGAFSTGKITLKINNINDTPIFIPGSKITQSGREDQEVRISGSAILKMFSDVDGDNLTLDVSSLATVTAGDTIRFDANKNELIFKPASNANGARQFKVRVKDPSGAMSPLETLSIMINPVNDVPIVKSPGFQIQEDGGCNSPTSRAWSYISTDQLLSMASDVDGDQLTVSSIFAGRTSSGAPIDIEFQPKNQRVGIRAPLNYTGGISFSFSVSDGQGGITNQTAIGFVTPVNDTPVASPELLIDASKYSQIPNSKTKLFYKLNMLDIEDGQDLLVTINRYPLLSPVNLGEKALYFYETGYDTSYGFFVTTQGKNGYFSIENYHRKKGDPQEETLTLAVTDHQGSSTTVNMNFWAYGYDPILIDLDSDGLEFIGLNESKVSVDRDGDGIKERLAWIKGSEAILAWDYNGDNIINRLDEIEFWPHVNGGDNQVTDLQAMGMPEFDSNQDGKFDAKDSRWSEFKFWRDTNENGFSDDGELKTLAEAGVKTLYLQRNVLNRLYDAGVVVRGYTRAEMSDGRILQAGDVQLVADDPTTGKMTSSSGTQDNATLISVDQVLARKREEEANAAAAKQVGSPQFNGTPSDQRILAGARYFYQLPESARTANSLEKNITATLANGEALPAWLSLNPATGTLTGNAPIVTTPVDWHLKITTPNSMTGSTIQTMILTVVPENRAPKVFGDIPVQFATEQEPFEMEIAPNFFMDSDIGDSLRLKATLADGNALPDWLHFDSQRLSFYGTPTASDIGILDLAITAIDEANATARTSFNLAVTAINDAPTVNQPLPIATIRPNQINKISLPVSMFTDPDIGDTLTLSATLADGSPLPTWLTFDENDHFLTGRPGIQDMVNPIKVRITATDMGGMQTSTTVTLTTAIFGTSGNDCLVGAEFDDDIFGEAGNDILDGKSGADMMVGGTGDDVYYIDQAGDEILENAQEGYDSVYSTISYILGENQEKLVLATSTSPINGTGNGLSNLIQGNTANNILRGEAGNDTLEGLGGNDTLIGGAGSDTYKFGTGHGVDWIEENDSTPGNVDSVNFGENISNDQLWLTRKDNNLEIGLMGTSNKLTLNNWYLGNQYHIEQIKTSNGRTLMDSKVQNLVNAMAAFSPPALGQTTLPTAYAATLNTVIAANWQ